jgi:hypothetical protein
MRQAHRCGTHKYLIHKDFIEVDCFINIPKLKLHCKAGMTCALKNLVGINGLKDYLPHFRFGSPRNGGDEFPPGNQLWEITWKVFHHEWETKAAIAKQFLQRMARGIHLTNILIGGVPKGVLGLGGGGWNGNDTLWRTVIDINLAWLKARSSYSRKSIDKERKSHYLCIVDGIIGGERESPLAPSPIAAGLLIAGQNPVAVDVVACLLMKIKVDDIPLLRNIFKIKLEKLVGFSRDSIKFETPTETLSVSEISASQYATRFSHGKGFSLPNSCDISKLKN